MYIFIYVFIVLCTHSQEHNYEKKNTTAQVKNKYINNRPTCKIFFNKAIKIN